MRVFLFRFAMFLFCFSLIASCAYLGLWFKYRRIIQNEFTLPKNIEVVSISDSHTAYGLIEDGWSQFKNLSSSGTQIDIWLWKLKWIFHLNPKNHPKYIILEQGVHSHDQYLDFISEMRASDWPCVDSDGINTRAYFRWITKTSFYQLRKWNPVTIDKTRRIALCKDKKEANLKTSIDTHFKKGKKPDFEFSKTQKFLDEIQKITKRHDSKIILISLPCHINYRKKVPQELLLKWTAEMRNWTEKNNATYFNYWEYPLNDDDFWDYDHLSASGRIKMTAKLREDFDCWRQKQHKQD